MSITNRLDDCIILMKLGRLEGALLSSLIAAAATSRKRYPKLKDGEAFSKFIDDETVRLTVGMTRQVNIEFEGKMLTLGQILYKYVRCHLAHEGVLFPKVNFEMGHFLIKKKTTDTLTFSSGLVKHLVNVIAEVPENHDEFQEFHTFLTEKNSNKSS